MVLDLQHRDAQRLLSKTRVKTGDALKRGLLKSKPARANIIAKRYIISGVADTI